MVTNLNTEPAKDDKDREQQQPETDQTIARAEKARLEALRLFYRNTKRIYDDRARNS